MSFRTLALVATLAVATAGPGWAADLPAVQHDPDTIGIGMGYFDATENDPRDPAGDFRLEYRSGTPLLPFLNSVVEVKPWAGLEATTDGGVYGAGGFLFDVKIGEHFAIVPSVGVGLFEDFGGKDLGSVIEFRSTLELNYIFDDRSRMGLALGHISNAEITDRNPGAEIVTVYYHMPLARLLGE